MSDTVAIRLVKCSGCNGRGYLAAVYAEATDCDACNGSGEVDEILPDAPPPVPEEP